MYKKIPIFTMIATAIAYIVFFIVYAVSNFYTAQNIIILIGAIYISVAWIKYLLTDNLLNKKKNLSPEEIDLEKKESRPFVISMTISGLLTFIIGIF